MAARGGSLTQFEKDCDDAVLDEVRRAQFVAFGEAPVIAYLAAKEAEIPGNPHHSDRTFGGFGAGYYSGKAA
ncbi:MAG: V-type ATPase subunit [Evtepia gabavorous]